VCISQQVIILLALVLIGWLVKEHGKETRQLTARVAMLAGLHPHHAAPDTFLPGGMSQDALKEAEKRMAPEPPQGHVAGSGVAEDEKEDAQEFVAMLRARAAKTKADKEYERGLREAAEHSQVGRRIIEEGGG
jgi:hypothetical protein